MASAVNQRVFDCPAAGGFLLTDAQAQLDSLFDIETEAAVYHSFEECAEQYRRYRKYPAERMAIARRARERVLNEHTYRHRLQAIVEIVRERFC